MRIYLVTILLALIACVLASVSNINLNPTGNYAKISTKGGLWVSATILIYMLFAELGYLPFKFVGRKKRSAVSQMVSPLMMFGDRTTTLKVMHFKTPIFNYSRIVT